MIAMRAAKIALVAAIALFASLVAFGNITDYGTNFVFVQHVLSMDTVFPFSTIKYRAITSPALHHAAYVLIIATEVVIERGSARGVPVFARAALEVERDADLNAATGTAVGGRGQWGACQGWVKKRRALSLEAE